MTPRGNEGWAWGVGDHVTKVDKWPTPKPKKIRKRGSLPARQSPVHPYFCWLGSMFSVDMCYCLIAPRGDGGRLDMVENITRLNMAGGIQSPRGAMKAAAFFLYRLQMSTKGLHPSQNK
jgi:hypothetical protein